jgi:hypothetical protein
MKLVSVRVMMTDQLYVLAHTHTSVQSFEIS